MICSEESVWSSPRYDILDFDSLWFLVKCRHIYAVSYLMDTMYRMSEQSQLNRFSRHDVYSSMKILSVKCVTVNKLHVHFDGEVIVDLTVALCMFTRSLIIKKRVEYVQLGVESYQKKLNITKPPKDFPRIFARELYTPSFDLLGVVYADLSNQKRLMRADELYKFSDETLKKVLNTLYHRLLNFRFGYNKDMSRRKWSATDKKRSGIMVDLIKKQMLKRRILRNFERFCHTLSSFILCLLS
ncbi:hypothetical protein Tco_0511118 [Tanacetum coccineum]